MAQNQSVASQFMVRPSSSFDINRLSTQDHPLFSDKDQARKQLEKDVKSINILQTKLYAQRKQALLIILQGMDCSGKDGTISSVFDQCNPMGLEITSFKVASSIERSHDYLWRIHKACPPKGMIGIFNRSQYEDVLVVKVEGLEPAEVIERRYDEINQFEKLLNGYGTRLLKFMLNISKEEQALRLQERVDDPEKRWKFSPNDLLTRSKWDEYMAAYNMALTKCSILEAPWYVIPADRNWLRNAAIAAIVRETLEAMAPEFPQPLDWNPDEIKVV